MHVPATSSKIERTHYSFRLFFTNHDEPPVVIALEGLSVQKYLRQKHAVLVVEIDVVVD